MTSPVLYFPGRIAFGVAAVLALLLAPVAHAVPLNIDVNSISALSPTQAGFLPFDINDGDTSATHTYGGIDTSTSPGASVTVSLTSSTNSFVVRDRATTTADNGTFTYNALYRDWAGSVGTVTIAISGLASNALFKFKFYSDDENNPTVGSVPNSDTFTNTTNGANSPSGTVNYGNTHVVTNDEYSTTLSVISSATGTVSFTEEASANSPQGGPILNGIEISSVPESSTWLVGSLLAAIGLADCVRRFLRLRKV